MEKNRSGIRRGQGEIMAYIHPQQPSVITPIMLSTGALEGEDPPEINLFPLVSVKPKYLPDLRDLLFPRAIYEQVTSLVITPIPNYYHDDEAATRLEFRVCAGFDIPKPAFPNGAPLCSTTYVHDDLLPLGFDAVGVFEHGYLSPKHYPPELLSPQHEGRTPALFVGHRDPDFIIPKEDECKIPFPEQLRFPADKDNKAPTLKLALQLEKMCRRGMLKRSATGAAELNRRLELHNMTVASVLVPHNSPFQEFIPDMQYNIYVPNLSQVSFRVYKHTKMIVAILSTIFQPNHLQASLATMGTEECPQFALPPDILPVSANRSGPRFMPVRYLPVFCDAGCIFPPGSLPEWVFQGDMRKHYDLEQYHYSMTPPVFVGRRKLPPSLDDDQLDAQTRPRIEFTPQPTEDPLAGKAKGFVLVESDHVPRGAIMISAFGAYRRGCLFKITHSGPPESPITFGTVNDIRDGDINFLPKNRQKFKPRVTEETADEESDEEDSDDEDSDDQDGDDEDSDYEDSDDEDSDDEDSDDEDSDDDDSDDEDSDDEDSDSDSYETISTDEYNECMRKTAGKPSTAKIAKDDDNSYDSDETVLFDNSVRKIFSVFTVDSSLDDIADAAGDLNTARLELIAGPSEMPSINRERAVQQFREVLEVRNKIRANIDANVDAHINNMTVDTQNAHGSSGPDPAPNSKAEKRKICSQCRKYH